MQKYKVKIAIFPMGITRFPYVPGTLQEFVFDRDGSSKDIWEGYLELVQRLPEESSDKNRCEEAINKFFEFVGQGRDNWYQVISITGE